MALLSGISEAQILEVKQTEIHEKASQSIKSDFGVNIVSLDKFFFVLGQHEHPP